MHREFRPQDMHQLDADPFVAATPEHHDQEWRRLYLFTALLGLLIGGDVLLGIAGLSEWRLPGGISLTLVAAVLGAVYIVYGALEALCARPDRGRFRTGAGVHRGARAGTAVRRRGGGLHRPGRRGARGRHVRPDQAGRAIVWSSQTPRTARVRRDGVEVEIAARDVVVGELVIVRPGERIPVDGPVAAGRSTVDQSALTGESIPVDKGPSDPVFTGTLNQFGVIEVHAEKVGSETTFGQVVRMVAQAQARKADLERWPIAWRGISCRPSRSPRESPWLRATCWAGPTSGRAPWLFSSSPARVPWSWPLRRQCSPAWPGSPATAILIKGGYALERLAALRHLCL